jgi:hypothetical protein
MKAANAAATEILTTRQLNRALLARQMLLERETADVAATIERLVGLQAQIPENPYVALWSRLRDFEPQTLSSMIERHEAVRGTLLRATLHLATARDFWSLRAFATPPIEREVYRNGTFGRHRLEGLDMDELLEEARRLLREQPRTESELRSLLASRRPDREPLALAHAARLLPLVQATPRGLWRRSGAARFALAESWLAASQTSTRSAPEPPVEILRRYLAAFGPATVADAQEWSGVPALRPIFEQLRPELVTYRDERDRELFDVPDAPRPDPGTSAPIRFLPEYDNALLGHSDRSRIISDENRRRLFVVPIRGALLVDGFVAGAWHRATRQSGSARQSRAGRAEAASRLEIELFTVIGRDVRLEVEAEGGRLLAFLATGQDQDGNARISFVG